MVLEAHSLTYDKKSRTFITEASSLPEKQDNFFSGNWTPNEIKIWNRKTDNERKFFYNGSVSMPGSEYESGEFSHWVYRSQAGIELHIFND